MDGLFYLIFLNYFYFCLQFFVILFYDLIYNPEETKFLKSARQMMHIVENGKMMFIYQAHQSFTLWHKVMPNIDKETITIVSE